MKPVRATLRMTLLLALALPLACVNPFKPATPELPSAAGISENFSLPDSVLSTMARAIVAKSEGGANAWLHAFADSTVVGDRAYRCVYDGQVKQNWEAATSLNAPVWDLSLEGGLPSYLYRIRANADYEFTWELDPNRERDGDPGSEDTVWFHRTYTLTSNFSSRIDTIGIGSCDLSFQKTHGRWSIFRWNDRFDPKVGVTPAATDERCMSWWRLESRSR